MPSKQLNVQGVPKNAVLGKSKLANFFNFMLITIDKPDELHKIHNHPEKAKNVFFFQMDFL